MESEFKVGQVVRAKAGNATLFEVVALPVPPKMDNAGSITKHGDPRLTVRFRDNPAEVRHVDPTLYRVVEVRDA